LQIFVKFHAKYICCTDKNLFEVIKNENGDHQFICTSEYLISGIIIEIVALRRNYENNCICGKLVQFEDRWIQLYFLRGESQLILEIGKKENNLIILFLVLN
jgi:hypothetical protein